MTPSIVPATDGSMLKVSVPAGCVTEQVLMTVPAAVAVAVIDPVEAPVQLMVTRMFPLEYEPAGAF